jgi:hypothetical protein
MRKCSMRLAARLQGKRLRNRFLIAALFGATCHMKKAQNIYLDLQFGLTATGLSTPHAQ